MNPFALSALLTGLSSFAMGAFVLLMNPKRPLNQRWCVFTTSVAVWGFGAMWIALETNPVMALWAWRLSFALGVVWIPVCFYHFVTIFCGVDDRVGVPVHYGVGAIFCVMFLQTSWLFDDVRFVFDSFYYARPGSALFPAFFVWWTWLVGYAHYHVYKAYRRASEPRRSQYRYSLLSFAIGYGLGSLDYLPIFGIDQYPYGNFGIPLYPLIMTYAIVKYGALDTAVAVEKSLAFLLLMGVLAIPTYLIALVGQKWAFGTVSTGYSVTIFALMLLLMFIAYDVKLLTRATITRTLFRPRYEVAAALSGLSESVLTMWDLHASTETIVSTLASRLSVKTAALYLLDTEKVTYALASSYGFAAGYTGYPVKVGSALTRHLAHSKRALLRDELEHATHRSDTAQLLETLDNLEVDLCLPLMSKDGLIGVCALGPRTPYRVYSHEDITLLETVARNAAIAIHNGMLYEELKRAQRTVQRTQRLRSLEIIAAGFAHEIRNPLTSIKTFLQLTPSRMDDVDFLTSFSQIACDDVSRIERLIKEILDYARFRDPQFMEEDLKEIISSCLHLIEVRADQQKVKIKKEFVETLPKVMVDRQQMKQTLLNLFLNALDAMAEKGGTLTVTARQVMTPIQGGWAQIEVTDTGCGIDPKDLDHIFDPFYTTKHESEEREGTGLGLTIVNQIMRDHHGYIDVHSTVAQGTTFVINLPLHSSPEFQPSRMPGIT